MFNEVAMVKPDIENAASEPDEQDAVSYRPRFRSLHGSCNLAIVSTTRIGITLGDPSGIGPEIIVKTWQEQDAAVRARLTVFADRSILERAFIQITGAPMPRDLDVIDRGLLSPDQAVPGRPSEAGGRAQVGYLEAALSAIRSHAIAGLVTAPINKHAARRAGFEFPGHTEFLATRLRVPHHAMMLAGPRLRVVLATVHMPLAEVAGALDKDELVAKMELAVDALERDFGVAPVRLGVLGLNPHAGEGGLFGAQESEVIAPAIAAARDRLGERATITGPLVPDAAFRHAIDGRYDVVLAMYHDQGLIPIKLTEFESAVNLTLGLPVVRTSPDHGVAYDIAGTGQASPASFNAALQLALHMVDTRARAESP
jgi:4-hydroxythreonine-4-phosphate dehydrogenase